MRRWYGGEADGPLMAAIIVAWLVALGFGLLLAAARDLCGYR